MCVNTSHWSSRHKYFLSGENSLGSFKIRLLGASQKQSMVLPSAAPSVWTGLMDPLSG